MSKLLAAGVVFGVIVAGASCGWVALQGSLPTAELPPGVAELEQSLALPGLLGLASVDVDGVLGLQRLSAQPGAIAAPLEGSWPARLAAAGIDVEQDVQHLVAAFYARSEEAGEDAFGAAFGAFGSFTPAELGTRLNESPEFEAQPEQLRGEPVLRVIVRDRATCEESGPWLVHASRDRLLIADPETMAAILSGNLHSAAASAELAKFRSFDAGRLFSVAAFLPEDLPPGLGNPMVSMIAGVAISKLEGFRAIYLGADLQSLPPGIALVSKLEADDAALVSRTASKWNTALDDSRSRISSNMPTAAALLEALAISAHDNELWVETRVGQGTASQLRELPGELAGAVFGALLGGSSDEVANALAGQSAGAPTEHLDPNPLSFVSHQPVEALPVYDPAQSFVGGEVDVGSGPFGLRLISLALPDEPEAGIEIAIEALGTGLSNLGESGERIHLAVTSVRARSGEELLANELCGPDRNDLPIAFASQGVSGSFSGTKTIRLIPGAVPKDVAFIEGHVELRQPVRTEAVRIPPQAGSSVARAGAKLALTEVKGGSVGWRVEGASDRMLHMRALNAAGQPLMQQSSVEMRSLLHGSGAGGSGNIEFAGQVAQLEAVFALEEERWEFPFALTRMTPGTNQEQTGGEALEFVEFPIERIRSEFAQLTSDLVKRDSPAQAQVAAGPFVVSLESVWSFGGLMPRFALRVPEIPNLADSLSGVELTVREIKLRDGTVHSAPEQGADPRWSQLVSLGDSWGATGLEGEASFETGAAGSSEEVAAISGAVVLRLPGKVSTLTLDEVGLGKQLSSPGVSLVVSELARDRFVLRSAEGGERLLGVSAYNAQGELLWMTGAEAERGSAGWEAEFRFQGVPKRIEAFVADQLESAEYPFSLQLASAR